MHQFHLGPVGALRPLPSPSLGSGPDATATRHGAIHRSLDGRVTVDRVAVKRTWSLTWPYLDPDTHAYLDALHHGLVAGPLWLVDPERRNRLPPHIAASGSFQHTTTGFFPSAGTLAWTTEVPVPDVPLAGGLDWSVPAGGGQLIADPCPVLPGEPVCMSVWVTSTVLPVGLLVALYDAAGAFVSFATSPSPATTPETGARLWLTHTPTAPAALARLALTADSSTSGGRVATTGWQLEPGLTPGGWAPGGGAAHVVPDALSAAYPVPGARATTLTLLEV
ncbi:hypothetical protein [Actinokineospora iranica]|uniref:Uncharacterized protein n=1 Tax=Actinokineospora iranica TaxID=1271860 RepID=A0A1G6K4V0_9PSEU|nr:hypothetical protein [Actinokineospora iranica]SDC25908.1 hypothetical protein SAMN05216174_101712 [Actinokineospora iranica]